MIIESLQWTSSLGGSEDFPFGGRPHETKEETPSQSLDKVDRLTWVTAARVKGSKCSICMGKY